MRCNQCGTEFEGRFCPECGARGTGEPQYQQQEKRPADLQGGAKPKKKKKPFFLRWWFILLAVIAVGVIALSVGGDGEKIVWDDIVLGDMLPQPPSQKGEVHINTSEELYVELNKVTDKQYSDYVASCKDKGFSIEGKTQSSLYTAYNGSGFKLSLSHYAVSESMSVRLEPPMELGEISWPDSEAGDLLPTPDSEVGKFTYEQEDKFFVYVGDTSLADYNEYVEDCLYYGFDVDYEKQEGYYHAENEDGWKVTVRYVGNNVISIEIDGSERGVSQTEGDVEETEPENVEEDDNVLDPDFKAAMDSYEKFMGEYVEFMKKYKANPGDLSILASYATYMSKYAKFVEEFQKWEDTEMNAAETAYYVDVQARVTKLLLEVAN